VQARLLEPELQQLGGDRAVVGRAGVLAARGPRPPRRLAQVAPLGEGQERNHQRARQRDHRAVGDATVERSLTRRGADEFGQPGEVGIALQDELERTLVGEQVLAEARHQFGDASHDLGVAALRRGREPRAGANAVEMEALEDAALLGIEPERVAPRVQRIDPREQAGVGANAVLVRGELRHHRPLHLLQRRRRLARRQVPEQRLDAHQVAARAVERGDRVLERRRRRGGDRLDLGEVPRHRLDERGSELLGSDVGERRQAEGRRPRREERVGHFLRWMSARSRSS